MEESLKKRGVKAAGWNFIQTMAGQVQSFVVSIFLARLLLPEDFAAVGMALVFANAMEMFVDLGFSNAIVQKREVSQQQLSTVFWVNMLLGVILSLAMYFTSGYVAEFFHLPILNVIVKVYSITFIIKALSAVPSSIFRKALNYRPTVIASVSSSIVSGVLGVFLAFNNFGVWSLVISQITNWILSTSLLWIQLSWRPSFLFKLKSIKDLWNFGYKYSITSIINNIFYKIDTIVIGRFFPAASLGYYYRAQSLNRLVIQYSFYSFSGVLFPALSKINDDIVALKKSVIKLMSVTCFTTFLFAGLMYVCAQDVIVILFGSKWLPAVPYFKIIGLFSICCTLPDVLTSPILSLGKSGLALKVEIAKKIVIVLSMPIGLYFGLKGYIWAINIAALITILLNMKVLDIIYLDMKEQLKLVLRYSIPFIVLLAIAELLPSGIVPNIFLNAIIKGSVFAAAFLSLNALLKNDGMYIVFRMAKQLFVEKLQGKFKRLLSL